ncbi:MAG: hypothetical protein KF833_15750 [Verrucomicrobiae bacterium]|nr:hypothetical protein [Verrucomicrobiae bacterium]
MRTLLLLVVVAGCGGMLARADAGLTYERDIAPIFRAYCAGCHNDRDAEGEFSVETFARLRGGGSDHGDPIVPGDPEGSFLIRSLERKARPFMPPRDEAPVPPSEIERLKRWIAGGAAGPEDDRSILETLVTPTLPGAPGPSPVLAVAASPHGTLLAVGRADGIEVRDAETGEVWVVLRDLPGKVNALQFSTDGTRLLAATGIPGLRGVAILFDLASGARVREFGGHSDILYDAEFSPDQTLVATGGYDREIRLWQVSDGALIRTLAVHQGAIFDLAWHPGGRVLASASADETVKLWRVPDGLRLDTLNQPQGELMSVAFTPDGRHILAAGADKRIHLWRFVSRDAPALNPRLQSRFAHETAIHALALSADGRFVLSSADDHTLKLWSLPDLEWIQEYPVQPDVVAAAVAMRHPARFYLGRMDGSTATLPGLSGDRMGEPGPQPLRLAAVAASAPELEGVEAVAAGGQSASAPARVQEREPNDVPGDAQGVTWPVEIEGSIDRPGDADLFRFQARAGEPMWLEVIAARAQSRLDSRIEVLHADGRPVEQVVLQATKDSWFTFRGKDSDTSDDFRVHNWAEMELDEYLYANGEVVRLWLYPRGPDSGFKVYPGEGRRHTFFSTTPLVHALGAPCYIVTPYPPGSDPAPNGLPVFRLNYVNDDDPSRRHGTDSMLPFTAPADGEYLARVTDVRGFGEGSGFHYVLALRAPRPDFEVSLQGLNPKVSPGSGRELIFRAQRHEGFDGPIRIEVNGLPSGWDTSAPVEIEAGQVGAVAVLYAGADAGDPDDEADRAVTVTATAVIAGREVKKPIGGLGNLQLGAPPKVTVEILPSEDRSVVQTRPDGLLEFSLRPGETLTARVRATRHDFEGRIEFGNEDSGRNLPHGLYVDNIGLNGLLIVEGQSEREFFITAAPKAQPGSRLFHLRARADDGQASRPALIRVLPVEALATLPGR